MGETEILKLHRRRCSPMVRMSEKERGMRLPKHPGITIAQPGGPPPSRSTNQRSEASQITRRLKRGCSPSLHHWDSSRSIAALPRDRPVCERTLTRQIPVVRSDLLPQSRDLIIAAGLPYAHHPEPAPPGPILCWSNETMRTCRCPLRHTDTVVEHRQSNLEPNPGE